MAVSKKQQACVNRYISSNYDRINLTVPKGKKDIIKKHAETFDNSINRFINRAIDETMQRDNKSAQLKPAPEAAEQEGK